jgi:plasmid stabilization system protein ParE
MRALASLETFPRRHPMAREAALFEQVVLRQMVHGSIRVLYVVREDEVVVLHARHASRQDLDPADLAGWPEDVRDGQLAFVHTTV